MPDAPQTLAWHAEIPAAVTTALAVDPALDGPVPRRERLDRTAHAGGWRLDSPSARNGGANTYRAVWRYA